MKRTFFIILSILLISISGILSQSYIENKIQKLIFDSSNPLNLDDFERIIEADKSIAILDTRDVQEILNGFIITVRCRENIRASSIK